MNITNLYIILSFIMSFNINTLPPPRTNSSQEEKDRPSFHLNQHSPEDPKPPESGNWFSSTIKSIVNGRLVYFLTLTISFYCSLLVLNYELPLEGLDYFTTHLRRFADAMVLALPVYLFCKKSILFPYIGVVTLFILSQLWYLRNYGTLMPASSYTLIDNLEGLGPSIVASMRAKDLMVIAFPFAFCIYYRLVQGNLRRPGWRSNLRDAILAIVLVECIILPSYIVHDENEYAHPFGLYSHETIRAYRQFGFINYFIYQCRYANGITKDEKAKAKAYCAALSEEAMKVKPFANVDSDRNLIIILVESLQSWPIGLKVDGVEVTPNINKLIARDSTAYFSKIVPQVKDGRSSDAQLLLNTGLLPIQIGAAASLFGTNDYPSLPKALKERGYNSSLLLTDNKAYWNQHATSMGYGYDHVYDYLAKDTDAPYQDSELFAKGLEILKRIKSPYMAVLVTMSGHDMVDSDLPDPFSAYEGASLTVKRNLIITHYVDKCIGEFVVNLEKNGMLDNCMLVITGDHDSVGLNQFEGRETVEISDRFIPLVIVNSQLKSRYSDDIMGQMEIYPTLLDEMGVSGYAWRGLGMGAARGKSNGAIYKDGNPIGNMSADEEKSAAEKWRMSDLIIRSKIFGHH